MEEGQDGDLEGGDQNEVRLRKDRLIQTRVARDLESSLKREAHRRGLSVSHLIRSILEDALDLVEDTLENVDQIVSHSRALAQEVSRGARRVAERARAEWGGGDEEPTANDPASRLDDVYAWNEVVLNRPVACTRCGREIDRGERAYTGLSDTSSQLRAWLCRPCMDAPDVGA